MLQFCFIHNVFVILQCYLVFFLLLLSFLPYFPTRISCEGKFWAGFLKAAFCFKYFLDPSRVVHMELNPNVLYICFSYAYVYNKTSVLIWKIIFIYTCECIYYEAQNCCLPSIIWTILWFLYLVQDRVIRVLVYSNYYFFLV